MSWGNKPELAAALRQWRERLKPADVGLPAGATRRRTPGLRREELAQMAGLSIDYIVRLEQARGPQPSASVLSSLSRALQLSWPESEHLFVLAGVAPPSAGTIVDRVRPSVLRLLNRMNDLPAMIVNARGDILAWNELLTALIGDLSAVPTHRRNHLLLHFGAEPTFSSRVVTDADSGPQLDRSTVAQAHAALARYPNDLRLRQIVQELTTLIPRFAALWDERPIQRRYSDIKTYQVPHVGPITLDCESLAVPDDDQTLVMYSAPAASPDAEKLEFLRVVGLLAFQ